MLTRTRLRLKPSKAGKILLFLAVFLLFAAQNTGNNLLYLMSSCFIACIVWAGTFAALNLSGLKVELLLPEIAFAGEKVVIRCKITEMAARQRFFLAFEKDFVWNLLPWQTAVLHTDLMLDKRGLYGLRELKIFSCFPADLFITTLEIDESCLVIGPKPVAASLQTAGSDPAGVIERQQSGKEGDYWMQTPYQDGADASLINWAISARSQTEWVIIRSVNSGVSKKLFFDLQNLSGDGLENCLMRIAGLLVELRRKNADILVWACAKDKDYSWISLADDFPVVVSWLACLEDGRSPLPDDCQAESVAFVTGKEIL